MFVDLMANIKNEVLHNLFRSTSNLQAFENFPLHPAAISHARAGPATATANPTQAGPLPGRRPERIGAPVGGNGDADDNGEVKLELAPVRREMPKVGRNDPCPCGSGKKYKNCCGRIA